MFGILLVLSIPFIKWTTEDSIEKNPSCIEWSIASIAYLINALRIFKYFSTFK